MARTAVSRLYSTWCCNGSVDLKYLMLSVHNLGFILHLRESPASDGLLAGFQCTVLKWYLGFTHRFRQMWSYTLWSLQSVTWTNSLTVRKKGNRDSFYWWACSLINASKWRELGCRIHLRVWLSWVVLVTAQNLLKAALLLTGEVGIIQFTEPLPLILNLKPHFSTNWPCINTDWKVEEST